MSATEEISILFNKLDELQEEVHAAVTGIIASQILWTEKSIEILRKQMLFYDENNELYKNLNKLGARIVKDFYEFEASSMLQRIVMDQRVVVYRHLVESEANCLKRFRQADADFDAIKVKWLCPTAKMFDLASMTVQEIKLTVGKWKASELVALSWNCTFDGLIDEWNQIKETLEKQLQESPTLASSY